MDQNLRLGGGEGGGGGSPPLGEIALELFFLVSPLAAKGCVIINLKGCVIINLIGAGTPPLST